VKILLISIFLFFFFTISQSSAQAAVLFSDDFSNGASQWTPLQSGWQVVNGKYGATVDCCGSIHTVAGDITTPNYSIELEMRPELGEDKNVTFRWANNSNRYEIHFNNNGAHWGGLVSPSAPVVLQNNVTYHFKIVFNGQNIKFYLDNSLLFDVNDPNYHFSGHEQVGLRIGTGGALTRVWFDNIVVRSLEVGDLGLPLLKQTDSAWGNLTYDSANIWSPSNPTIGRWGCALTSAAMVFHYHGITKMPDGSPLTPSSLNTWLTNRPQGYGSGGYLNFAELSKLSKIAKFQNDSFDYDSLEFVFHEGQNNLTLKADLEADRPVILKVPGHFIVAKGITDTSFNINDPFYNKFSLSEYGNSYLGMRRFIPANSDLSYIIISTQNDVEASLEDSAGNPVGIQTIETPILDPVTGIPSGEPVKLIYFAKPSTGEYELKVSSSSPESYEIEVLTYNEEGDHKRFLHTGIVGGDDLDNISISFNKEDLDDNNSEQIVTFDSLIADINSLRASNYIRNFGVYISLLSKAGAAKGAYILNVKTSKNILNSILDELKAQRGKHINVNAYNILHADIQYLLLNL